MSCRADSAFIDREAVLELVNEYRAAETKDYPDWPGDT